MEEKKALKTAATQAQWKNGYYARIDTRRRVESTI